MYTLITTCTGHVHFNLLPNTSEQYWHVSEPVLPVDDALNHLLHAPLMAMYMTSSKKKAHLQRYEV